MKPRILFLFTLLIIPFIVTNTHLISASEGSDPQKGDDGKYHIKIIASQWEFIAVDLETGKEYKHRIGSFEKGSTIVFEVVSKDVQHGFSVNELNIAVASRRPLPGEVEGAPTIVEATLPNKDTTLSAFCQIFCGLGHPDMKIKITVADGSFWIDEAGGFIFFGLIILNIGIFALFYRSIFKKSDIAEPTSA